MTPTIYILLYIGLWIISLLVFRRFKSPTNSGLGQLLMLLWMTSACVSIWMLHNRLYYNSTLYKFDIVSFFPLLYLWLCIMLYATPLLGFKVSDDAQVTFCSSSNYAFKLLVLKVLTCVFLVTAIGEFYAYTLIPDKGGFYAMTAGTMNKKQVMEDIMGTILKSRVVLLCHRLFSFFSDSMICFSFVLFLKNKKKQALIVFFAATSPIIFGSILTGNRQKLICLIMTLFITFQIFRPLLSEEFKSKCKRIFFICAIGLSVPVVLISVLRFGDYTDILVYEILRYFGESCLNFSSWLFPHLQGHDNGRKMLSVLFKELPFYNPPVTTLGPYFYTFIGGIIQAIGRMWTFIIGIIFCISAIVIKQRPQKLSLGKALLMQTIAVMCFEGLFGFIHHLYIGAFFIGFLGILFLDTNWMYLFSSLINKVYDKFFAR